MNRWRALAIVLLILIALELIWVYAHWSLITTAWKNRATIGAAGDVAAGVAGVSTLVGELKSIL